ncbi:MAG: 4-hydroxy-tetrahydrodipicolinate reductase [Oscillospiraceae bacterium]
MLRIIIQGINGRMGKTLCHLISERDDCAVVCGIDQNCEGENIPVFPTLSMANIKADVVIDFSVPSATISSLAICTERLLPCVICTTGFTSEQQNIINTASKTIPIFQSANMSLGVNLLIELVKKANAILGFDYDIEIIEKHHNNKIDAPSGTALMLANAINEDNSNEYNYVYDRHAVRAKRDKREIGIHSVRGGNIVGEHDVIFAGQNEVITLSHSAASRDVFASGAVSAAIFLAKQAPGIYNMEAMINKTT